MTLETVKFLHSLDQQSMPGDYMEIGHMLPLGGDPARFTDTEGTIALTTGEVNAHPDEIAQIVYQVSIATAVLREVSMTKQKWMYPTNGCVKAMHPKSKNGLGR